jgi:L-rhamnose mutarotase
MAPARSAELKFDLKPAGAIRYGARSAPAFRRVQATRWRNAMIRRAFTMQLKPGAAEEYIQHHDGIPTVWPQLVEEIRASGIARITTFRNGLNLFLYSEIADVEAWDRLWNSEVHRRWAELMQPLMHMDEHGIVQAGELQEIFHLETKPS